MSSSPRQSQPHCSHSQSMIREWEAFYQKPGKHKAKGQRPQVRSPAEKASKNRLSIKAFNAFDYFQDKGLRRCREGLCSASLLGTWTKQYRPDQRIALGRYSPLEKELLRLGGVHTVAARRFLTHKQDEERKMLKGLHMLSSDYRPAMEYQKQHPLSCSQSGPQEKLWTAKVTVPAEEFQMPRRERLTITKHIERMQFARALQTKHFLPYIERCRGPLFLPGECLSPELRGKAGEDEGDGGPRDPADAKQEERDQAEDENAGRQKLQIKVTFKSEEPEKPPACHPNDRKPFLLTKRPERRITGLTNRNLLHAAEFPGDLLLLHQDVAGRKTCLLEGVWSGNGHRAASQYH